MSTCPFCKSEVAQMKIGYLDLRMCPKCFSVFFPCNQTSSLRSSLPDKSRELWYNALLAKNVADPDMTGACCIDHGEPLVDGKIPDYGYEGKATTCCKMFHLPPSMVLRILKRTLDTAAVNSSSNGKHHFFFIRAIDSLVSKLFGEKQPDEDPLDAIPYNIHLKKFFE